MKTQTIELTYVEALFIATTSAGSHSRALAWLGIVNFRGIPAREIQEVKQQSEKKYLVTYIPHENN